MLTALKGSLLLLHLVLCRVSPRTPSIVQIFSFRFFDSEKSKIIVGFDTFSNQENYIWSHLDNTSIFMDYSVSCKITVILFGSICCQIYRVTDEA